MKLPIEPPFEPMDALARPEPPEGAEWQYEPKWDGFRALAFRDGDEIFLQSKTGQPMARYFPDVVAALSALETRRFVLDGELVIPIEGRISFEELQLRLHPAASRVAKLAAAHPAMLIAFDLLVDERGALMTGLPLRERRSRLEQWMAQAGESSALRLSPATSDLETVRGWFRASAGSLDGIIAKNLEAVYESGQRSGAVRKIKTLRTADCVVGGFRYASSARVVGSLLLGLYNHAGLLDHVGFTSSIPAAERKPLTARLQKLRKAPGFTGNAPGGPSRWSTERTAEWEPLDPRLVVEVQYDHFTGGRFRHGTKLLRWRSDKAPEQCTFRQVEQESGSVAAFI